MTKKMQDILLTTDGRRKKSYITPDSNPPSGRSLSWATRGPQSEEMERKGCGLGRSEINRKSNNAKHTFHRF